MELCGQDLDVVPVGQFAPRHAHCVDLAVMAGPFEPALGVTPDQSGIGLLLDPVRCVRIEPEIGLAVEGLRVLLPPGLDLVGIDQNRVAFDPGGELREHLLVGIFRHARVEPVVPVVKPADQVPPPHEPVRHERAPVQAATIENRDLIVEAHDDKVDLADKRIGRLAIGQFGQTCHGCFVHLGSPSGARVML